LEIAGDDDAVALGEHIKKRPLPRGASDELPVNPRAFVFLQANYMQPARAHGLRRHGNVRAASGHIRGDRDHSGFARLLDDPRFIRVLLGV